MRLVLNISAMVFVGVCATWAYRVNYQTQEAIARVEDLRTRIADEREAIGMLEAEWTYLNRPDRLQALVDEHADVLGLVPLQPEQFGEAAMVAYPPEPDDMHDAAAGADGGPDTDVEATR